MTGEREANVLGALAQAVTDRTTAAITAATGQSPSAAAALTALDQFLDRPTLDRLRLVLGLTPSGAVRLVDRLSQAGLVTRGPGGDGRSRSVMLTERGRAAAAEVAAARATVLRDLLGDFSAADRKTLGRLLDRLMAGVVAGKDGGGWICRQCDLAACERAAGRCPAANAAAAKYAQP
ncbi:MarR family winged helix-turn-helix transcriptional regulator [Virgisporangium aurantiacum]|uniref:MarR family winged helix-turn-helix transcriptional regulator n=1 Tax=Virgisporangium aurantiacum TaxID=175570 RepID=UPI0019510130|nr:MarR family winged helix-turn-helix transcriptional regulator [Virgisporangium aurantiacum]